MEVIAWKEPVWFIVTGLAIGGQGIPYPGTVDRNDGLHAATALACRDGAGHSSNSGRFSEPAPRMCLAATPIKRAASLTMILF